MKYCSMCGTEKGNFIKYARNKLGVQYYHCNKCNRKRLKKYRDNNKEKIKKIVRKYELSNKDKCIPLQPCSVCGNKKSVRHHPDYKRPLYIIFLCPFHHKEFHKKLKNK